ncbi:TPA: response regulator transcription factor [Streptococcus equi subsp. zooepidemicus]|nr:response regulator transcription factor [Streptococcus equi subsp. zooepidemicus]
MNIFILEDDLGQQFRLEMKIQEILDKHHWTCDRFEVYGKPYQLLANVTERGRHQLFFLDIQIRNDEKKGLAVAREIRKRDPYALIVFVTTHSELMPVSFRYQVSALDFIDKELSMKHFSDRIERAIIYSCEEQENVTSEGLFIFVTAKAQVQVPFSSLLFIETSSTPHKLILHSQNERIEFYGFLSEVLKQDSRLVQCHRSYVINPYNVSFLDRDKRLLYFKNGQSCMVSRLKMKALEASIKALH